MVLQMSQKQILIKLMTAIPRFQWNTQRKAFGTNAQPRIARYGSSRGLGTSPTRKIPMWPGKLHRYFCLCIYKGPARQFANLCNPTIVLFWPCYRTQTNHLRNRIFSDKIKCMILIICDLNWNERYYNGRKLQKTVETLD